MMVEWDLLPRNRWELFHKQYKGGLQQSWAYGQALQSMGVRVHRATLLDAQGQPLGLAQFMVRRFMGYLSLASCTRGPVWREGVAPGERAAAYRALKKTIPTRPLRVTLASPDAPLDDAMAQETRGLWRVMTGYSTVLLDLRRPLEELRAGLDGKWRNRLAKAEAEAAFPVRVEPSLPECQRLLDRESQQRAQKKFLGLPTDFVTRYIEAAPSREAGFAVSYAQDRKDTVAAMLFLVHGSGATYHVGWASEAGRKANTHNVLLWRGIEYLRRNGVQTLDLGGVNSQDLPGITRFKLGTGGQVATLAGTYF
jgi:hypothetical protein